jgi:hypothetical protein
VFDVIIDKEEEKSFSNDMNKKKGMSFFKMLENIDVHNSDS